MLWRDAARRRLLQQSGHGLALVQEDADKASWFGQCQGPFQRANRLRGVPPALQGQRLERQSALEEFLRTADAARHTVSVFEIPEETIFYWANLNEAALIHKNLTSSTVDLEALMKKIIQ